MTFNTLANQISFIDPLDGQFDMSDAIANNPHAFLPIPIVLTEPAIGYGGGLFGLFLHESDDASQQRQQLASQSPNGTFKFTPPNLTLVGGAKTENGTWFAGIAHRHTWNDDSIRYRGALGYANINMDIYKNFDLLPIRNELSFESQTQGYGGMQKLLFQVNDSPLYVGASQVFFRTKIGAKEANVDQFLNKALGDQGTTSGLGIMLEYDTRDNIFYPKEGGQAQLEYLWYRDGLGSDYDYDTLNVDGQYYVPLSSQVTLGLAANYQSLNSEQKNLPPLAKPYIDLRGIARYRYQGNYVLSAQTQLMWQVDPRWTVQTFVGVGSAENKIRKLYQHSEIAYGAGFRYSIARRFGLKTGVDVAFSDEDSAVYFNVGTGF